MRKTTPAILIAVLAVALASALALARPEGTSNPTGLTGVSSGNCTNCHSATLNSGPGKVTIQAPTTFAPGSVVAVTISLSSLQNAGGNGFQMAAYDAKLALQGGWIPVDGNTGIRSNHLNHSKAGQAQSTWRAYYQTAASATSLQFNACGLDGNNDGKTRSDRSYTTVAKMTAAAVPLSMTAAPKTGTTVPMALHVASDAGKAYVLASSFGNSGIPLPGTRSIPLALDALTILTLQNLAPTVFRKYQGNLSASGTATASIVLPNISALVGQSLFSAFVVVDPKGAGGIGTISNGLEMRLY